MRGVVRTRVGYAGGTRLNPTYYSLGDHTETLQLEFDPTVISYEEIMKVFWMIHNPCARAYDRQYMSAVFYETEEHRRIAEKTRDATQTRVSKPITTPILPLTAFYRAEDYHQKYQLRHDSTLMREFRAMYPDDRGIVDSTAAAKLNGYLAGYGSREDFEQEIETFGLSPEARERVRGSYRSRR